MARTSDHPPSTTPRRAFSPRSERKKEDLSNSSVPFRDADPESGEIPLDELDSFVVPARDDKGTSEPYTVWFPPYMKKQIELVVHSQRFPYLKASDFIRHACYRHLRWTASIRQSIPRHLVPALEAALEVCRDDEYRVRVSEVFTRLQERISYHTSRGNHSEVRRLVNLVRNRLSGVEDNHWSKKVKTIFVERFEKPHLSISAPASE